MMFKIAPGVMRSLTTLGLMLPVAAHQPHNSLTQHHSLSSSTLNFQNRSISENLISFRQNYLSLSRHELKESLYLSIKTKKKVKLLGWIYLNNRTLQKLEGEPIKINLSSVLKPGINEIDITGFFRPVRGSVMVELKGVVSSLSQSTRGDGVFQQKIRINVN